jgi:hypothetical protein
MFDGQREFQSSKRKSQMPSPKSPYADAPLVTNRAQRKQLKEIGMEMEPVEVTTPSTVAKAPRRVVPPMTEKPRPPVDYEGMAREAEAQKKRKRY